MILIDSCGWLEYFANADNADFFASPIKDNSEIVVPTIILYEIWKKISRERGEEKASEIVAQLKRYEIVPLDESLSLSAAKVSYESKLAMADSIVYATAKKYNAILWTQDADFENLENVKYIKKKSKVL